MTQEDGHPKAGWYDDPQQPGRLRWWDGEGWTDHTEARPSKPEVDIDAMMAAAASKAPGGPDPETRRLMPWIIGGSALLVLFVVTALVLSSSADNGSGTGSNATDPVSADAAAMEHAHTAQTAIETYAVDHGGSYEGATPADLVAIEPTLEGTDLSVAPTAAGYSVSVTSESGNEFTITRDSAGASSFSCTTAGAGGCPTAGDWS